MPLSRYGPTQLTVNCDDTLSAFTGRCGVSKRVEACNDDITPTALSPDRVTHRLESRVLYSQKQSGRRLPCSVLTRERMVSPPAASSLART